MIAVGPAIVSLVGNGTVLVIAAVVAAGLAAGHWLGGPDPDDRTALAIASSMRHPGVAMAIAERLGDQLSVVHCLNAIGASLVPAGYIDQGRYYLERSRALA